ncbi:hypothetical protein MN608_03386 [Microdochium nivale]|nr:hypothetical protein MN608_03386 [Microdochium nivale]
MNRHWWTGGSEPELAHYQLSRGPDAVAAEGTYRTTTSEIALSRRRASPAFLLQHTCVVYMPSQEKNASAAPETASTEHITEYCIIGVN